MLRTSRLICSKSLDVRFDNLRSNSSDLERLKSYVSSAHPTSHIYLVKHAIPEDESPAEKRYRMMREEYQLWNHFYWEENNKQFQEEKAQYIIKQRLKKQNDSYGSSHEDLAPFYRDFLDRNYEKHITYNKQWYQKQFKLLLPALAAFLACKRRQIKLALK